MALQDQWQAQRQERQHEIVQRRQAVQIHLDTLQHQRQAMAQDLANILKEYVRLLQAETTETLTTLQQERLSKTQLMRQKLAAYHTELQAMVADLRLEYQVQLDDLREVVQTDLTQYRQQRLQLSQDQRRELTAFVDDLQLAVSSLLDTLKQQRYTQAANLNQFLQTSRQKRAMEMQTWRTAQADFRERLRQSVWQRQQQRQQPAPVPVQAPEKPPLELFPTLSLTSATSPIPATLVEPPRPKAEQVEEAIYNYLLAREGARLTEIESNLEINRFQAVDALRALMQKDLVLQKDRVYQIQEEAVL